MKPRVDSPGLGLGLPLIGDLTSDFAVRGRADGAGTELAMRFELTAHAPPGAPRTPGRATVGGVRPDTKA